MNPSVDVAVAGPSPASGPDRVRRSISNLFAAGHVSATVFGDAYPGGGATLGCAVTRAYAVGGALAAGPPHQHPTEGRPP